MRAVPRISLCKCSVCVFVAEPAVNFYGEAWSIIINTIIKIMFQLKSITAATRKIGGNGLVA
jgi:hypothetical protein